MIPRKISGFFAPKKQSQLWMIDIDGTIIDVHNHQVDAWLKTFEKIYNIKAKKGTLDNLSGKPFCSFLVRGLVRNGLSTEDILKKYDLAKNEYVYQVKKSLEREGGKILPGAIDFLKYLGKLNIPRAIVTGNPEEEAVHKLRFFNLMKYYEIKVFAKKRHRDREELVREATKFTEKKYNFKLQPKNIKIVGDSIYDVLSAKNLGFISIGVATGTIPYGKLAETKPRYLLRSLKNYKKIIDQVLEETK